ncbi:hypothetical protein ACU8KH_03396 [Lachancea thermotolerans]
MASLSGRLVERPLLRGGILSEVLLNPIYGFNPITRLTGFKLIFKALGSRSDFMHSIDQLSFTQSLVITSLRSHCSGLTI